MYTLPQSWQDAYIRFNQIFSQLDPISKKQCQKYLLDFGRFNANFNEQELRRHQYPMPPFQTSKGHHYVRAEVTALATYCAEQYTKKSQHSEWLKQNTYAFLLNNTDAISHITKHVDSVTQNGDKVDVAQAIGSYHPLWIQLDLELAGSSFSHNCIEHVQKTYKNKKHIFFYTETHPGQNRDITILYLLDLKSQSESNITPDKTSKKKHSDNIYNIRKLLSHLGYLLEPSSVIDALVDMEPELFFNREITSQFLNAYAALSGISISLPDTDKTPIHDPHAIDQAHINRRYIKLKQISHEPYNIYADYAHHVLDLSQHSALPILHQHTKDFLVTHVDELIKAARDHNLPQTIRRAQYLAEFDMLLHPHPPKSLDVFIAEKLSHLTPHELTTIVCPYALQSFDLSLMMTLTEHKNPRIAITSQSYFEWLDSVQQFGHDGISGTTILSLEDVNFDSHHVVFTDIHPNNSVVSLQGMHDVTALLKRFQAERSDKSRNNKFTLIVDITLNHFDDPSVLSLIQVANPLIEKKELHLILVQSMTKFMQLGLDKRDAGICISIHGDKKHVEKNIVPLKKGTSITACTNHLFQSSYKPAYLDIIRDRVNYAYSTFREKQDMSECLQENRFQLLASTDTGSCYLAIDLSGLIFQSPSDNSHTPHRPYNIEDLEKNVSPYILSQLIHPLCDFLHVPISERSSIGFGLSSINIVMSSLRLTIGTEPTHDLDKILDIFIYTAFVLNRHRNSAILLTKQDILSEYLQEKTSQYMAMSPGHHKKMSMYFDGIYGHYHLLLDNGNATLLKRLHTRWLKCHIHMDGLPSRALSEIDPWHQKMAISCLSEVPHVQSRSELLLPQSHVKIFTEENPHDNHPTILYLSSYDILQHPMREIFGPFNQSDSAFSLYLVHEERKWHALLQGSAPIDSMQWLANSLATSVEIKCGSHYYNIRNISSQYLYQMIRNAAYQTVNIHLNDKRTQQHQPSGDDYHLSCSEDTHKLVLGQTIYHQHGISIFARNISTSHQRPATRVDIHTWLEKNQGFGKRQRLILALLIKKITQVNCIASDESLTSFMYGVAKDNIVQIASILKRIITGPKDIRGHKTSEKELCVYDLCMPNQYALTWPSGQSGETRQVDSTKVAIHVDELYNKYTKQLRSRMPQTVTVQQPPASASSVVGI